MTKIIQKGIVLEGEQYYHKHLEIINPFLPVQLTKTEIKVLAMFMSFEGEIADNDRFGTSSRKVAREKLGISNSGITDYFKAFISKNVVYERLDGKLELADFIKAENPHQFYQFKIIKQA